MTGLADWLLAPASQEGPAWFGKLPALGDFAHRRGNERFNGLLDAWLQRAIPASRAQLHEGWTHAYVGAPLWSFALFPGVCGEEAYAGVLMSSVDRVGRYFPLTVYTQAPYTRALLRELQGGGSWYPYIQQALPQVLNTQFTHDQFEALLAGAPPAPGSVEGLDMAGSIDWAAAFQQGQPLMLPSIATAVDTLGLDLATHYLRGNTLWWAQLPGGATVVRAFKGMPPPEAYTALLTATG
ncbi:type VI secretion system-associated protein TagF [Aquabacterium sp. A7-Y]|uniref:type VI secretion system-associated protein TagF n=1 Tax=Aquabacterium sp. A7-Y TaxID=1349605 RepID=UPI00223D88F3|nr:type VI secretion system-associated protein TagF [Aquabacterium sp. A7-Y]MCW7540737.1 type VI secretion system-associated protein TagF [Aquabacterium sp. A7-Y]